MKFFRNLTFLLPVYNGGGDLCIILKSLENLNGTVSVIIYNDGSTDNSYQIACEYAEKSKHKVRVIDGKRNRGYFRVIKILLRLCSTDFYIFLGHDDRISFNYLDEFDSIILQYPDIACVFSDIATITPKGITTNTWPSIFEKGDTPKRINCLEAAKTFNKNGWGNLFVAIWSKQALSHKTLLQIMKCVPNSPLTTPLKLSGFLNDNMAVLRALSFNDARSIYYNSTGIYFKEVDPERVSEGNMQFKKEGVLHNPLGYLSIVAHFMLPQLKQRSVATRWCFHYIFIYLGVFAKRLLSNPGTFNPKTFLKGIHLIFSGLFNNFSQNKKIKK